MWEEQRKNKASYKCKYTHMVYQYQAPAVLFIYVQNIVWSWLNEENFCPYGIMGVQPTGSEIHY